MTAPTSTTTTTGPNAATADRSPADRPPLRRGTALGLGLALAATTTVFAVGNVGAPVQVVTDRVAGAHDLGLGEVVATTVVTVLAGAGLLWLLDRRRADGFRLWVGIAAVVAVVSSIPLWGLDVDTGSKVALTTMHLVTGVAAVVGHAVVRHPRTVADPRPFAGSSAAIPTN